MSEKTLQRRRGRPPTMFIKNPRLLRIKGETAYRAAWERYEEKLAEPFSELRHELKPPRQGRNEIEKGLRYAAWAKAIPHQAIPHMLRRLDKFCGWLSRNRPARGPSPCISDAEKLFVAVEVTACIHRQRDRDALLSVDSLVESEIGPAWELLYGHRPDRELLRRRLNRFKPRLLAFQRCQKVRKRTVESSE